MFNARLESNTRAHGASQSSVASTGSSAKCSDDVAIAEFQRIKSNANHSGF